MADTTYQPKTYHKMGGDEFIAASGGRVDFESGAELRMQDGSNFDFFGNDYSAARVHGLISGSGAAVTVTNLSTASTTLSTLGGSSPPVLPSTTMTIFLSCTGTGTNLSARLPSAVAGKELYIRFTVAAGGSTASVVLYGSTAGFADAGILLSTGSSASSISVRQSAASWGFVYLKAVADGYWAVLQSKGATEQASS